MVFTCNHCPYALAWHDRIAQAARDYADRGVRFLAISSNDAERYPRDSYDAMKARVAKEDWPMPYLYDQTQEVARAYGAKTTPDLFRGRFRGSPALPRRARLRPMTTRGQLSPSGCAKRSTRCSAANSPPALRRSRSAARSNGRPSGSLGHAAVVGLERQPRGCPIEQPALHVVGVITGATEGLGRHRRAAA